MRKLELGFHLWEAAVGEEHVLGKPRRMGETPPVTYSSHEFNFVGKVRVTPRFGI